MSIDESSVIDSRLTCAQSPLRVRHALALLLTAFTPLAALAASPAIRQSPAVQSPIQLGDDIRPPEPKGKSRDPVLLNLGEIMDSDNYPELALAGRIEGKVTVRVAVDARGLPTTCVTLGAPPPELGGQTCALMLGKARFAPALDRRGKATASVYERPVVWMLEKEESADPVPGFFRTIFTFHSDGKVASCVHEHDGGEEKDAEVSDGDNPGECKQAAPEAQAHNATLHPDVLDGFKLIGETRITIGDVDGWKKVGEGPGDTLHSRQGHQVTVRADGTVSMCKPLHPAVLESRVPKSCAGFMEDRFVPTTGAERVFTFVSALYSRPRGK